VRGRSTSARPASSAIRSITSGPCLANRGRLSARKHGQFAELDDATIAALEQIIGDAMAGSVGDPP
jgi:hypothetical protein